MQKNSLNNFINNKLKKITFLSIIIFFIIFIIFTFLNYTAIKNAKFSETKQAVNYITLKMDYFFNYSEIYYNNFLSKHLNIFYEKYNKDNFDIINFMDELKEEIRNSDFKYLKSDKINYYLINSSGIIYESDFDKDIGLNISVYKQFWNRLKNLSPGEIKEEAIAEETTTGINRLYAYLKLDNGEIFQLGISFANLDNFLVEICNEFEDKFKYFNILSSYYIALIDKNYVIEKKDAEKFIESKRTKDLVYEYDIFKGYKFYYAIPSPYGLEYKYLILETHENNFIYSYFLILSFFLLMILISSWYRKKTLKSIEAPIKELTTIIKDMENYRENKFSEVIYNESKIEEIDLVSKNYLKMMEEINSSFEQLEAYSEDLTYAYQNNEVLINKMNKILDLTLGFNEYSLKDEILIKTFNSLFDFIPEADGGLLLKIEGKYFDFIASKNYDIKELNDLKIDSNAYIPQKEIQIVNPTNKIKTINSSLISEKQEKVLGELLKKPKSTLYIPIFTEDKFYGSMTLHIKRKDSYFSKETLKFAEFFSRFIKLYLFSKDYGDQIRESYRNFSNKLATVAEAHDDETGNHIIRVGIMAEFFAKKLNLSEKIANEIRDFAPLHDIGKIFTPITILKKPDKLTAEEWEIMKNHTIDAKKLLAEDERFETALKIALYHHEKFDGTGYPIGLKGEEIPIEAQIVSIVDVYDALRSIRSYKKAYSHEEAFEIITGNGRRTNKNHFNPQILEIFKKYSKDISMLWEKHSD